MFGVYIRLLGSGLICYDYFRRTPETLGHSRQEVNDVNSAPVSCGLEQSLCTLSHTSLSVKTGISDGCFPRHKSIRTSKPVGFVHPAGHR